MRRLKDGIGIFLVVLSGALYMSGVTDADPHGGKEPEESVQAAAAAPAPLPEEAPVPSRI